MQRPARPTTNRPACAAWPSGTTCVTVSPRPLSSIRRPILVSPPPIHQVLRWVPAGSFLTALGESGDPPARNVLGVLFNPPTLSSLPPPPVATSPPPATAWSVVSGRPSTLQGEAVLSAAARLSAPSTWNHASLMRPSSRSSSSMDKSPSRPEAPAPHVGAVGLMLEAGD